LSTVLHPVQLLDKLVQLKQQALRVIISFEQSDEGLVREIYKQEVPMAANSNVKIFQTFYYLS